ncbi:transcriptional regulator [Pontibacillus halophilus JSM 076056 = DSM 19796]|uniref:Transcriptional regulator n=1 Tax=Pontibacillus halophilus JSM 076056 = DSM 19796 TaxID=1385510 RepID=A0A0A5GKF1_9BACI|nr:TetR/AcrR family transcriptional regulator [Pontibacillus halophilus]KGX91635.1 transcriptional regulator [Pontibacillus halophilus JSM 076056 = DSM 19796]
MKRKEEERKSQLLKATFQAIYDKSFSTVTLQDISDYAGVSKGVTNYYFRNKEDVFAHLLQWITDRIYEKEATAVNGTNKADDKLQAYLHAVFIGPEENEKFYQVYLEFLAHVRKVPLFHEINQAFHENCYRISKEIIQTGIDEGLYSKELQIESVARNIRAVIDGTLIQWLTVADREEHDTYKQHCYEAIKKLLSH